MDRPEYELVTNAKEKYENQNIFSMISPYFCDFNIIALSTINVEAHGGGRLFDLCQLLRAGRLGSHA